MEEFARISETLSKATRKDAEYENGPIKSKILEALTP
jgi:hypothetical protein